LPPVPPGEGMKLFEPYELGGLRLPNRIVMAPMTRNRAIGTVAQEMAVRPVGFIRTPLGSKPYEIP
jgi:hypothetical protein